MKRILSLMLTVAMVFTMIVVPVVAAENPTATAIVYMNEAPDENGVFYVGFGIKDVSSNIFVSGQVNWNWPAEVASLYDYDYGTAITNKSDAVDGYHITSWVNPYDGKRSGKYNKTCSSSTDLETGYTAVAIAPYKAGLEAEAVPAGETLELFEVAYILNEGASIDDFYIDLVSSRLNIDPTSDVNASTSDAGEVKLVSEVKPAAPDVTYYDEASGKTYTAVSDNFITAETVFTNAKDGGALAEWVWVDKSTVDAEATEGQYIHRTGGNTGGSGDNTMRTFFPIEGGKTYYVTNTIYNNTGAETIDNGNGSHGTAGMSAIVATSGGSVYGSFSGLTQYSPVEYGGRTSWTNNDCAISGTNVSRIDMSLAVGYNKVEVLINAPAEATHLMISYGAHSNTTNEIYYGDFAIYEMEVSSAKEEATATFNYTCNETVVGTVTVDGFVGDTVSVEAGDYTAEDGTKYAVEAGSVVLVSGGNTVAVAAKKYETVTVNYVVDEATIKTVALEGFAGEDVAYDAVKLTNAGKVYEAVAGTVTVDPAALTVNVEATEVANTVAAYKTGYFNVTQNAVGVYPSDRALAGTDALYSADWNDVRYGEMVFALDVEEGEAVNTAVLTLVPGDIMTSHPMTFDIYAADPATYNTANDVATLAKVGSGEWTAVNVATDVTLDLSEYFATYPEATEILLLYKTVGGLSGVYGASTTTAPYITYEIGEYVAPTEPSQPETEPSQPETEPSQPETEPSQPETEPSQPETEPSQPETEPSQPETEPSQPETEPSQPETEPSQPETDPSQPETEPSQPETEPSQPETEPSQPETEPSQPETEPSQPETEPSQPETEPSQPETEPSQPETEPSQPETEPTDEPSEEPGDEAELPFEAVDVVITPSALGVTISGKFVDEDTTYETVVVVISYLKDGKAYSVQATEVEVKAGGVVNIPASNVTLTEGELTVAGISVLVGVNALEAITTGNLGTPVGVYK